MGLVDLKMPESTLTRVVRKIKLATKEADEKEQKLQKLQMQINFITNQIKSKQEKYEKSRGEMEIDNEKLYKMKSIHYIRETVTLPAIEWTLKEKENEIQERKVTVENYKVKRPNFAFYQCAFHILGNCNYSV